MGDPNLLEKFVDFLNEFYKDELIKAANEGKKSISIDFSLLEKFDVVLADYLLDNPAESLQISEKAIKDIDIGYVDENFHLRFFNLPGNKNIRIRNVRAEHIGKFLTVEGFVKRASEVRPEVSEAVFQCLECGSNMTITQTERIMKVPMECENPACRNRRFKLVGQKLYDARWVVVEEPFEITEGERPSDLRVFLKDDLTSPKMQNKTDPGNRIKIVGILKELPRRVKGSPSRQMEIYLEASHVESVETDWDELEINSESEQKILELAKDPEIYTKLANSVAPGLYGLDDIKLAIIMQLFAGETHVQKDRSRVRGDIHVLLVGDPSTAKSSLMKVVSGLIPRGRYVSGKGVSVDFDDPVLYRENKIIKTDLIGNVIDKFYLKDETGFASANQIEVPCLNPLTLRLEWKPVTKVYRHTIDEDIFKIQLRTGREVRVTADHSVFTIRNNKMIPKKASELKIGDIILIPNKLPKNDFEFKSIDILEELRKLNSAEIKHIEGGKNFIKSKFSPHRIPKSIRVDKDLMRLLGYYIADGSIDYDGKNQFKLKFDIDRKDRETIDDIKNISKRLFGIEAKEYQRKDSKCNNIYIHSKIICLLFKDIIGVGRDAHKKKVPSIIFNVEPELQKQFLYAWIRGDYGVTVSKELISDIMYLLSLNGTVGSFITKHIDRTVEFPDGHKSRINGEVYELKSPKVKKILKSQFTNSNLHSRVPLEFFQSDMIRSIARNEYVRVSNSGFEKINSKFKDMIYKRLRLLVNGLDAKTLAGHVNRNKRSIRQYLKNLVDKGLVEKRGTIYKTTDKGRNLLQEYNFLLKLRNSDLAFLKIQKIEKIKPSSKFVYDFSVDNYENFVAGFGGVLCHNTGAGLTATVVKDEEFLGGWVLEAGALVMTNRSLCAIDEFEKIEKTDQVALHEMMEQQTISIAKANIVATLPAMTSILAGGNPKLGRFDPYLPIKEQIDIPETILSRFDLKFALRDIPNPEIDAKVTEHILQSRHFGGEQATPFISNEIFKKYVAYARKNCHPKLTREAADELRNFYLSLRERSGEDSPISITPRQYEALIRMTEASAKVQLREDVLREDAIRAVNLMKASLRQFGFEPETGKIDIDRAEGAKATSAQRNKIRTVLDILDNLQNAFGKDIPFDEVIKRAKEQGVEAPDDILKKMQQEGLLYSSKIGMISKI